MNESSALAGAGGPTEGKDMFSYNYYGSNLFVETTGLFNEINKEDRISKTKPQIWKVTSSLLKHKSGGTDAAFICRIERKFDDKDSRIEIKVG